MKRDTRIICQLLIKLHIHARNVGHELNIDSCYAEMELIPEQLIYNMAVGALAPSIARTPAVISLTACGRQAPIIQEEKYQPSASS